MDQWASEKFWVLNPRCKGNYKERKRKIYTERDVAKLVRSPNGDHDVMGSTPTFHSGI